MSIILLQMFVRALNDDGDNNDDDDGDAADDDGGDDRFSCVRRAFVLLVERSPKDRECGCGCALAGPVGTHLGKCGALKASPGYVDYCYNPYFNFLALDRSWVHFCMLRKLVFRVGVKLTYHVAST